MKKASFLIFSVVLVLSLFFGQPFLGAFYPVSAQGNAVSWIELDEPYGFYVGTSKTYLSEAETTTNEATYRFGDEVMEIALTGKSEYAIIGKTFGYVDFNELSRFSWHSRGQSEYTVRFFSDEFELKRSYVNEDASEQFYMIDFERENIFGVQDLSMEICVLYEPDEESGAEDSAESGKQEEENLPAPVEFSQMSFQGTFDEFYRLFPVTLDVSDIVYGDQVANATLRIDGKEYRTNARGVAVLELSKGMHYYSIDASGYRKKSGYFEVDQEYDSEAITTVELELQGDYKTNENKVGKGLIIAIVGFSALNIFFVLLYVLRKEEKNGR